MMFQSSKVGDVTVLAAPGALDSRNAQDAREFLKQQIKAGESKVVIDLSSVTFIDSSGLGVLLTALKAARASGGDVRLTGLTPPVKTIFELTRLFQVFSSFPTVEQAIQSF
jgi:anti-sigma B factor antagonist